MLRNFAGQNVVNVVYWRIPAEGASASIQTELLTVLAPSVEAAIAVAIMKEEPNRLRIMEAKIVFDGVDLWEQRDVLVPGRE